jgi:hypothetical protein
MIQIHIIQIKIKIQIKLTHSRFLHHHLHLAFLPNGSTLSLIKEYWLSEKKDSFGYCFTPTDTEA